MVNTITDLRLTDIFLTVGIPLCLEADGLSPKHKSLLFTCPSSPWLVPLLPGSSLLFSDHRHLDHPNFSLFSPPPACHLGPHMVLLSPEQINASRTGRAGAVYSLLLHQYNCLLRTRNTDYQMWSEDQSILFGKRVIKLQPHQ